MGIRGALERTYCNVFIALQFLPRALSAPRKTREENRMRARRRAMLARKTKCAWSPRRKLKLADMKRKIWHRNRSFTLLIAEHTV